MALLSVSTATIAELTSCVAPDWLNVLTPAGTRTPKQSTNEQNPDEARSSIHNSDMLANAYRYATYMVSVRDRQLIEPGLQRLATDSTSVARRHRTDSTLLMSRYASGCVVLPYRLRFDNVLV